MGKEEADRCESFVCMLCASLPKDVPRTDHGEGSRVGLVCIRSLVVQCRLPSPSLLPLSLTLSLALSLSRPQGPKHDRDSDAPLPEMQRIRDPDKVSPAVSHHPLAM